MLFFKRSYQSLFANKYKFLINAIRDMDYETLEQIWSPALLDKIASEVYRLSQIENCSFDVLNDKSKVTARIVNYSKLLIPSDIEDKSYENYSLIENNRGIWEFIHKDSYDDKLEQLRSLYKEKYLYSCNLFFMYLTNFSTENRRATWSSCDYSRWNKVKSVVDVSWFQRAKCFDKSKNNESRWRCIFILNHKHLYHVIFRL